MNTQLTYALLVVALLGGNTDAQQEASGTSYKPRVINTTDLGADPDDEQSMVRQLVCANEFDIEGLIVSTGCWKKNQSNTKMLDKLVDAYGECYDNLKVHAEGFPTVEYLRSISVMGQKGYGMGDVGDGKDSPGSELIIASVDKDDPRPVWVGAWGGANNVAQAIWKVRATRSKAELDKFLSQLRVFDILGQDDAGAWITKNFPKVLYIRAVKVYGWQPPKNGDYQRQDIQSHGPLGAVYPDTKWATEGDTPAFMHVYPNGLNDPDQIDQGGWGGRFSWTKQVSIKSMRAVKQEERQYDPYEMYGNSSDGTAAIKRWSKGYDNDFAARMDWSITSKYEDANHHPIAIVNGDKSRRVLEVSADPGAQVKLSAEGSKDPDKDALTYAWSFYDEPSSFDGSAEIANKNGTTATVSVPSNAAGKNLHIILELHDDGEPNLYAYRRVIVNVSGTAAVDIGVGKDSEASDALIASPGPASAGDKPRIFVLTDIENEPDDAMSMVRFLTYANHMDIEGLAATTSVHQQQRVAPERIRRIVAAYGKVRDNLETHEQGYPTGEALLNLVTEGIPVYGRNGVGEGKDSPASEALIKAADKDDPRPMWVTAWGGPSVLAQSLWKVRQTRSAEELKKFVAKLRVYTISDQDDSGPWIREEFPDLFYVASPGFHPGGAYHHATWSGISGDYFHARCAGADFSLVTNEWLDSNVRHKGPLGKEYPHWEYLMEGDTPSFLNLINNGLSDHDHPDWGGWGGRYEFYTPRMQKWFLQNETRPFWSDADDEVIGNDGHWYDTNHATIWRWREAYQNDFSARMDWTIKSYAEANHPPVPKFGHSDRLTAKPGDELELSAEGSNDPDGDALSYNWFYYPEPGSFTVSSAQTHLPVAIKNFDQVKASFQVPTQRVMPPGEGTMHFILEVKDHGTPRLTRYRRVIVDVKK